MLNFETDHKNEMHLQQKLSFARHTNTETYCKTEIYLKNLDFTVLVVVVLTSYKEGETGTKKSEIPEDEKKGGEAV